MKLVGTDGTGRLRGSVVVVSAGSIVVVVVDVVVVVRCGRVELSPIVDVVLPLNPIEVGGSYPHSTNGR